MFLAAAFVPGTALLVPGAAGQADVLAGLRADALEAVRAVLATRPDRLVVVAPGTDDRTVDGPVRPGLGAAGVPDRALGWPVGVTGDGEGSGAAGAREPTRIGVAASVAVLLVQQAGGHAHVRVVETRPQVDPSDPTGLRARGALLATSGGSTGFVVAGSLSARHGPEAPLADDARAAPYDAEVLEAFADAGPAARDRLAALDGGLAAELAVSGWAPWQVLLGALGGRPELVARVLGSGAPFGAQHLVATWLAEPRGRA